MEAAVFVRFVKPKMHLFGPPDDAAIAGHPLSSRGLACCHVYRVERSSLVRGLQKMNSTHPTEDDAGQDGKSFENLNHSIFTFHDSTFECIAESFEAVTEQIHVGARLSRMVQFLSASQTSAE
jgi:hypothetical protein